MEEKMFSQEDSSVISNFSTQSEHQSPILDEKVPAKRGKYKGVVLYEVESSELDSLEKGSDASVWLNFGIASVSIFVSLMTALLTLDAKDKIIAFSVFVIIASVSFIASCICFVFWFRKRVSQSEMIKKIRERIDD